jgi:hypothetical protein
MPACECLPRCPFFNDKMANMPTIANFYKERLCNGEFETCARYVVFRAKGREAVPADLFPDQTARAKALLEAK